MVVLVSVRVMTSIRSTGAAISGQHGSSDDSVYRFVLIGLLGCVGVGRIRNKAFFSEFFEGFLGHVLFSRFFEFGILDSKKGEKECHS